MATEYVTLNYTIWLTDAEQVKTLQAARARVEQGDGTIVELNPSRITDPGALYTSPAVASGLYSAAILGQYEVNVPPSITSEYIVNPSANPNYPLNEYKFERKSGGWFGISWLFGDTTVYRWRGTFAYKPTNAVFEGEEVTPDDIPTRRWIDGMEHSSNAPFADTRVSRDASRHTSGLGHKAIATSAGQITHQIEENDATLSGTVKSGWERFYMRRRGSPDTATPFYELGFTLGMEIVYKLLPTNQIMVGDGNGGSFVPMATLADAVPEDEWIKVDTLYYVNDSPGGVRIEVYINGELKLSLSGFQSTFANIGCFHDYSSLGIGLNGTSNTVAMDFDDWINAEIPVAKQSIDWLNGTKIVKVPITAYGTANDGNWTAPSALIGQALTGIATRDTNFTSNVANAILELLGDADFYKNDRGSIGPVSVRVRVDGLRVGAGANNYQLGYRVAGGAIVYKAAHTFSGLSTAVSFMYQPAAVDAPDANVFDPLSVVFQNEGGAPGTSTLTLVGLEVELCGIWGPEDVSAASVIDPSELAVLGNTGKHVSPYPDSIWARRGPAPMSPVFIKSGTFTGNGTSQTLSFNAPVTYFFCRQSAGGTSRGAKWWSSMTTPRDGDATGPWEHQIARLKQVDAAPAAEDDQQYTYELDITGLSGVDNAAGSTYWYVAFCDPGMRFSLNTALRSTRPTVAGHETDLILTTFTPEAAFGQFEEHSNTTTGAAAYKGISDAATSGITRIGTAYNANGLSFAAGKVIVGSDWITLWAQGQYSLALWRQDDGSGDPGVDSVLQLATWVGDGAASRTINFPRTTGKRPLFVFIWPNSTAVAGWRDPQNTGTTSQTSNGTTWTSVASTGISSGGIDQFTVGTSFNANGVVYNAFILIADATAGNNGWGVDGEYIPVVPAAPSEWPGDPGGLVEIPDPLPDDWIYDPTGGGGGGSLPGSEPTGDDFGAQCVEASTKVCQQALAHIGVTVYFSDITTDNTVEAQQCRLFYVDTVNEALRAFTWAWATKYADLARVAGLEETPVNWDWTYAYRLPTDLIFARRLVRPGIGRRADTTPPPFRQAAADTTGRLLYTNYYDPEGEEEPDNTVHLEYTFRPNCAAGDGDATFRRALTWLMASKLAPGLSRNKVTAADCLGMFNAIIAEAAILNAREQQRELGRQDASWTRERE